MAAAIPMAIGLAGSALSSFGNKGTNSQSTTNETDTTKYTEDPNTTAFRNSLYGPYQQLLAQAQQPMYGKAEQASYTNQLNKATNAGQNSLAAQLAARTGSVNSGAFASGLTNLLQNKIGAQAQYAAQVPGLNKQAALTNTSNLLGLGMNFAGRAPVNSTTTKQGTTDTTSKSSQGFASNFANGVGGMLGQASGAMGGIIGGFGGDGYSNPSAPMSGFDGAFGYNNGGQQASWDE